MLELAAENSSQPGVCVSGLPHTPGMMGVGKLGDFLGGSLPFQVEKLKLGVQNPVTEFAQYLSPWLSI